MDDPVLVKAIREYLTTKRRLEAAGTQITPEHEEEFFRVRTGGKYGLNQAQHMLAAINTDIGPRNLTRSAVQGATFDFGDELLGVLPESLGGGEGAKEEMRLRQDLFRDQHPIADAAAGVAGGIGTGFLLPGAPMASVGRSVARGALYGAGAGAAYGVGRGEGSLVDRAPGAVIPAAVGGALGATLPALVAGARALAPAQRAARRVSHAVEESGGLNAVHGENVNMDLAGRGQHAMLSDLTDRLRLEGDFAVNNSDDVLARVAAEVNARHKNASQRILNDAVDLIGQRPNAPQRARELKLDVQKFGHEGYDALRELNPTVPLRPEAVQVLQQPVVSNALAQARKTGMIGHAPDMGKPSFQHLQDVKEALDDATAKAFRDGHGNLGTRLAEARDVISGALEKVPGYAEISAQYGAKKATERALVAGSKAWDVEDVDQLAQSVGSMAPEALEQFRYGMAAKMISRLRNTKTNRDAAKEIMDGSDAMNEKLKVVFGSQENTERYLFRVEQEAKLAKAKSMFGNSATARRLQSAGFDPLEMGLSVADGGIPGPAGFLAKLYSMSRAPMDRAAARQVGRMVTTKGTQNIDAFLATLHSPQPLLGRVPTKVLPVASGGLLGPGRSH